MSTKAIHLELAGDLSTVSFLGALTRFVGRRGRPVEIWSDNRTIFRGACHELQRLLKAADIDWGLIKGHLALEGIVWNFIPPSAPYFGGLWEAGVKSIKMHLHCVAGPRRLTYEEFSTLLVSVEAVLNSRPLAPPSGDLSDLDALTSSHFLIGTSSTSLAQPVDPAVNLEHSTHWDLVKGMRDRYWVRCSREYLNTLLQRLKWRRLQPNFRVGDFVVIVDASLLRPHGQWPMGRVVAVYPGADGLVRTVTVRTATGEYMRPIVKLARLPLTASSPDVALPADSTAA
ncbi:uncharacterized protein LOC131663338 [Phymastichus coffea]|uniref:uncharacterized protein LOC131663338 n=1 Tax=Phymastichus coffea TaxID=108790 RepID=UPI00273B8446|nr:uncharacterized protein LOC131663338 [Phymastichus coffea]